MKILFLRVKVFATSPLGSLRIIFESGIDSAEGPTVFDEVIFDGTFVDG